MDFAQRLNRIKTDIRDLKTAQLIQSDSAASIARGTIPETVQAGSYEWLIEYEDDGETTAPLVSLPNSNYYSLAICDYDPNTNTQIIQFFWPIYEEFSIPRNFFLVTSRHIRSFTPQF